MVGPAFRRARRRQGQAFGGASRHPWPQLRATENGPPWCGREEAASGSSTAKLSNTAASD